MNTRNIQRSGNTYYVYLPSAWCKANKITPKSKVNLETTSEGSLLVATETPDAKQQSLTLKLGKYNHNIANKFLAASYLNPVKSFKIKVEDNISPKDVLDHKKQLGGIEIVGFQDNEISCESLVSIDEPDILLKTMLSKMINMIELLKSKENQELVELYESEMDKSNLLITKAAVASLMFKRQSSLRHIDLFYIASLSKNLEAIADQLVLLAKHNPKLLEEMHDVMRLMHKTIGNLTIDSTSHFVDESAQLAEQLKSAKPENLFTPLRAQLINISEVLVDWAVTNQIDAA